MAFQPILTRIKVNSEPGVCNSKVSVKLDNDPKLYEIALPSSLVDGADLKELIAKSRICPVTELEDLYATFNGRKLRDNDRIASGSHIHLSGRLRGGKGGFGSMLRAIGAQIEKTTNREACRDLSGRRLRDIAEEMRLKKWIAKQSDREQEKAARRKEKLERRMATPRHVFRDTNYDKQRSEIPEKVNDALMQGLAVSKNANKRHKPENKVAPKRPKLWMGIQDVNREEYASEEMETSSDSTLSSAEDSDEQLPGPSGVRKSAPSTSASPESLPETSEASNELSEEPVKELPLDLGMSMVSGSTAESINDEQTQEEASTSGETKTVYDPFDLDNFDSVEQLESLGLDRLKVELASLGLKCGGTLKQRAERLFSIKGLSADQIKPSLLARPIGRAKK